MPPAATVDADYEVPPDYGTVLDPVYNDYGVIEPDSYEQERQNAGSMWWVVRVQGAVTYLHTHSTYPQWVLLPCC